MSKLEARLLFLVCLGRLLLFSSGLNIRAMLYEFYRSPAEQKKKVDAGLSKVGHSQHQDWLAVDFVIMRGEVADWSHSIGDEYEKLGVYWESLHPLCRWGGRFGRDDATGKPGWDAGHFELSSKWKETT